MTEAADSRATATARADPGGVRAVSRALDLLQAFAPDRTSLSLAELVRATGLPRTTVLRLVDTLVAERMLQHGSDGRIAVGTRLIRWGAFAGAAWTVPAATSERMAALSAETGETVSLYVRSGIRRVVIAQSPSPHSLRHVVQVGDELPLWIGAAGSVLLAAETDDAIESTLDEVEAGRSGDDPAIDRDDVRSRVAGARRDGHAVSHGAREPGNSGVAVLVADTAPPRRPHRAQPVVLAVGGPTSRFTEEAVARFVAALHEAAIDVDRSGLPPALG
ncbi:IclR family transcriptional regulator [Frigoribacterium sp. 2-23]|uniref:IclR family transcriptional regulator n=1 Tax=Frigoribacterium sp. 2-23 TaxID=3415006 RepID=UPI003C6F12EA